MSNPQQPPPQGHGPSGNTIVFLLLRSITCTGEVFLHREFGSRYLGLQAAIGGFIMLFFGPLVAVPGTWALRMYLAAYVIACLYARIHIARRRMRGEEYQHTLYSGRPHLLYIFPRLNEVLVKRFIEPLLVMLTAALIMNHAPALGLYLLMVGAALYISVTEAQAYERKRAEFMHDTVINATQQAERFRSMSGRR